MPDNWFSRNQNKQQQQQSWLFSVEAAVRVPETGDEEKDSNLAKDVLLTTLNRVEGDASSHTAIDSSVQFQIQFDPIKR